MKGIKVNVGGKDYELRFTMAAWEQLEDEVCLVDDLGDKLAGRGRIKAILQVFSILSGADLDEIRKAASPSDMRPMMKAIWEAINGGMHMVAEHGEDKEVDVTLEEIEKKEGTGA